MQKIFYIFTFIIATATFSAVFPYPIFSNHTNISESVAYKINNYRETELVQTLSQTTQILSINFDIINCLLPIGEDFEIIDMQTCLSFEVKRTGGNKHADIEPVDEANTQILQEISKDWSWERRPVLVKLNENAFVPASITYYPHGYSTLNTMNGHLCLHFKNSKMDGTKEEDIQHQHCVKYAQEHGKEFLDTLE